MQINLKALSIHLKKNLAPIYLISSDEPFLAERARNSIIETAKKQGFIDREIMHIETGFQWEKFSQATQNGNLFSEKKLIDCRNQSAKFDATAISGLSALIENPSSDTLVIISTQKLTSAQQKAKWFKLIEKKALYIPIWPIPSNEYPRWIKEFAKNKHIQLESEAAQLLAETVEGNLFAATQAIEKCALLFPEEVISSTKITTVISDNAQFTVFDLTNALLLGQASRVYRISSSLEQTGTEAILVLWAISKELRELLQLKYQLDNGASLPQLLTKIWTSKKPFVQAALKRVSADCVADALQAASEIDMMIKGAKSGNPWEHLNMLCLGVCQNQVIKK